MKNQSFNILFIMRRARTKKSGLASIYARITTGGMRQHESDIKSSTKMPQN